MTNYRCDITPWLINRSDIKIFLKIKKMALSASGWLIEYQWSSCDELDIQLLRGKQSWIRHHLQHLAFKKVLVSSINFSSHSDQSTKYISFRFTWLTGLMKSGSRGQEKAMERMSLVKKKISFSSKKRRYLEMYSLNKKHHWCHPDYSLWY